MVQHNLIILLETCNCNLQLEQNYQNYSKLAE